MTYKIHNVVVIGSGTMGGGIAAHCANTGLSVTLLDIAPREGNDRNAIVRKGWEAVVKSRPAALMHPDNARRVTLGNLEDNFSAIATADWVVEVVVERLEVKQQLMARIDEARRPNAIITSNTSGIPIRAIQEGRSESFRQHFCGTHFFNPPRYMKLLELIPGPDTSQEVLDTLHHFMTYTLGKGVVVAKDRPNFVGNRIGSFAGQHRMNWIVENGYGVEEVDAISGPFIGNPKTATFRLMDLVGIDIAAGVSENLYHAVPEDEDRERLRRPAIVQSLLDKGALGNKTGSGFFKKVGKEFYVLNMQTGEYEAPTKPRLDLVGKLRKIEPLEARLKAIFAADPTDRSARFFRETSLPALAYASKRIPEIADHIEDIDNAMKWGYAQSLGPFEVWDAIGVAEVAKAQHDMGWAPAPWVDEMIAKGITAFYQRDEKGRVTATYDPNTGDYRPLAQDPMQIVIDDLRAGGKELERNEGASLLDMGDGVLLLEFHTKMNALDQDIMTIATKALAYLEQDHWKALVVGNQGEHFCAGANIALIGMAGASGNTAMIRQMGDALHEILMRMRFSPKPVVVAVHGMALGGGAEVVMHSSRVVASSESYIGLVEAGVGLLPGAGGIKEQMRRVISAPMAAGSTDVLPHLQKAFETVALAKVSTSAEEARGLGYLTADDKIVMNASHLLAEAKHTALLMVEDGYTPPDRHAKRVYACGNLGLAALRAAVFGMVQGRYVSDHDAKIANKIAEVMTGGDLSQPQWVTEDTINALETEAFLTLAVEPKSIERIMAMLQTGKPLRN
jgi:3-hydroxyacyl-CoA dehydrogenase